MDHGGDFLLELGHQRSWLCLRAPAWHIRVYVRDEDPLDRDRLDRSDRRTAYGAADSGNDVLHPVPEERFRLMMKKPLMVAFKRYR